MDSSTAMPPDPPPAAGDGRLIADRFRLLEPLGRGGMGRVYRARDELLGRLVAVKLIYDDAIIDSDVRHACALEARAAARLNHPGIVRILDSGFDDGHLFVVMSLADGRTLAEVVRADGPLPAARALEIAMQVADALDAAHQEGIVHCDVKPGNLIVRPHGSVQLVDFGIARITASTTSLDSSTLQGSAEYVAPEQVEGHAVDGRTDLYALGVVLYEMLAGRTPFGGGTIASVLARRLVNDPPSLRDTMPQLPVTVDHLVRRMLARNPADRYQTAGELHAALADARQVVLAASLPPPPPASLTATMPFPQQRARARGVPLEHLKRAGAGAGRRVRTEAGRQGAHVRGAATRLRAAGERAVVASAIAALAAIQYGRALVARARPFIADRVGHGTGARHRLRRPLLLPGIGIAVVVGLLIGTAAARCNVAGASAEAVVAPTASVTQPELPPPAVVPPQSVPAAQPAATPPLVPTPTRLPTPEPDQPETATESAVQPPPPPAVPAQGPAAPPIQVMQPMAAPPALEKQPEIPASKPEDKKPEVKKAEGNGSTGRGSEKQDARPRGNNGQGGGPQKKR